MKLIGFPDSITHITLYSEITDRSCKKKLSVKETKEFKIPLD